MSRTSSKAFACAKCGHNECEVGEIRTSGGPWSAIFDFNTERFSYVACARCSYTEFYKTRLRNLSRVVDFMLS